MYYGDGIRARQKHAQGATFHAPALSTMLGLREALEIMRQQSLPSIFRRHQRLAAAFRAAVGALGLRLLAQPEVASPTVTAVYLPEALQGDAGKDLSRTCREKYGPMVAGG